MCWPITATRWCVLSPLSRATSSSASSARFICRCWSSWRCTGAFIGPPSVRPSSWRAAPKRPNHRAVPRSRSASTLDVRTGSVWTTRRFISIQSTRAGRALQWKWSLSRLKRVASIWRRHRPMSRMLRFQLSQTIFTRRLMDPQQSTAIIWVDRRRHPPTAAADLVTPITVQHPANDNLGKP